MICVYVLISLKDTKKYTGSTINLQQRLKEHITGLVTSTKNRRPLKLFGYQQCKTIEEAAFLEKRYKNSHGSFEKAIKNGYFILVGN